MAYTDTAAKNILQAFGKVKGTIYDTVVCGDLLAYDDSNYGFMLADQGDSDGAIMIACSDGVSGDEIDMALAVEFDIVPAETLGVWSQTAIAVAGDQGKPLYLGESGKASSTVGGTYGQEVGRILSLTRAYLCAMTVLTGVNGALSGNLTVGGTLGVTGNTTVGGTLAVTGASTLTGAVGITGALTCAEAGGNVKAKGFEFTDGGVVTQITSVETGVTLNNSCGQITSDTDPAITAGAEATFQVTNSLVAVTDVVVVSVVSQPEDGFVIAFVSATGAGTFDVTLSAVGAANVTTGTIVIAFAVIAGAAS